MKISNRLIFPALLLACLIPPTLVFGVTVSEIDTFEDGTTENWLINLLGIGTPPAAALPVNIASGGPGGADDNYMQLTALGGVGSGSRLTVINVSQWAGDYTAAGITEIAMDLRNFGLTDLSIRLYLANPMGAPLTDDAVTSPVLLPAGGEWTHAEFALDPLSLTALTGDVQTLLTGVTELRIFHNPAATFPGPAVSAVLGVDNITALRVTAVPEPSALTLLSLGLVGLFAWKSRKKKSVL